MIARVSFFFTLLTTLVAQAGESTHYTLDPVILDSGGLRATSANYSADFSGSAGGAGGSTTYTARSGYAVQLSDAIATVIGMAIAAPSLFVNEGSALQLSASVVFDDATTSPLAANEITWSVSSGPLTGIDAAGLVTAGIVYEDSAAVAQGDYQGFVNILGLTVLDSDLDNFGSYAADGVGDDWQVSYFGLSNQQAAPSFDADGDGQSNAFEYTAGLIPTDASSRFTIQITPVSGQPTQQAITFDPTISGRSYTVKRREFLDSGTWLPLAASTTSDAGAERTVIDAGATATTQFYIVEIVKD
jgi:hypothetical protein